MSLSFLYSYSIFGAGRQVSAAPGKVVPFGLYAAVIVNALSVPVLRCAISQN